jgi:phage-related protein (TIGR01555 family)
MATRKTTTPAPTAAPAKRSTDVATADSRFRRLARLQDAVLQMGPPPDPYRRDLVLPKPPFRLGADVKELQAKSMRGAKMAFDDAGGGFPFASFLNTAAGLGSFGLYFPGYPYLAELAQRSEFRQPTETTAKEMTRKWISLRSKSKADKSEQISQLEDDLKEFKVQSLFRKATEHDGFFGLGWIYVEIKNQQQHEPLTIDAEGKGGVTKGSLEGFRNVEPMWTTPLIWNSTDPTRPDFYNPTAWMVLNKRTDSTRLMKFISREVPDIIKPAYNFGGVSLTQLIQSYVDRWLQTVNGVNRLINNFSIINLQTELDSILEGDESGANDLKLRCQLFNKTRDNQGLFATNKATEGLEQLAVPLSGLSELQAQAQEHMAAPTHLPLVVLTGITPSGLNASSDSEIEIFHDWIHSMQENLYEDNLTKIIHILQLNRFGKIDDDIVFDFVQLKQLTGEALARVKKTQSEMDATYVDASVVTPEEVRKRIATDPDSGYNNLATEMPQELVNKALGLNPDGSPMVQPGLPGQEDEDGAREDEPAAQAA